MKNVSFEDFKESLQINLNYIEKQSVFIQNPDFNLKEYKLSSDPEKYVLALTSRPITGIIMYLDQDSEHFPEFKSGYYSYQSNYELNGSVKSSENEDIYPVVYESENSDDSLYSSIYLGKQRLGAIELYAVKNISDLYEYLSEWVKAMRELEKKVNELTSSSSSSTTDE